MSHHHDEVIVCPNCGSHATGNYCSQCGQENHLHQETVLQLISHFFGHYIHYDSKFWKTLKVLWLRPGALTVAYHKKQRMRYISPISLYIFISAIYFFIAFALPRHEEHAASMIAGAMTDTASVRSEIEINVLHEPKIDYENSSSIKRYFKRKADKIAAAKHMSTRAYFNEKVWHSAPKLMFLMIPVFALLFAIRFRRRKDFHFVDHTIFSFHTHSFWFSIRLLSFIEINKVVDLITDTIFYLIFFGYMVQAIRKVYDVTAVNAAITLLVSAFLYTIVLAMVTAISLVLFFMIAG